MRLDQLLVEMGLAQSRHKAQALVMAKMVLVDGKIALKPGQIVKEGQEVKLVEQIRYVSRGGLKLEGAIKRFGIDVSGLTALDIGASTGGFTDCLLKHGARKVVAVDVGRGQLDYKLKCDSRVISLEKTDARSLKPEMFQEFFDVLTVDVSFISITKVLENVVKLLKDDAKLLLLVKPQFELSPKELKKGIVKSKEARKKAVLKVAEFVTLLGYKVIDAVKAEPSGTKGNEEFFLYCVKGEQSVNLEELLNRLF